MIRDFELNDLYVPTGDRQLRHVQRKGEELDKQVRIWAQTVLSVLPRGLPLDDDEKYLYCLFSAAQRRLNLQLDAFLPDNSLLATAKSLLPGSHQDPESFAAIHRIVALRLDSDIERGIRFYCEDNGVDPESERAIDWRVAIRFMAQSIYSRGSNLDVKRLPMSPRRFELAVVARDLASDVTEKRAAMLAAATAPAA
ncbi:MAG: hypothetical protein ABI559_12295 [Chloroflexota bacterium]